jgi:hypothetical protein
LPFYLYIFFVILNRNFYRSTQSEWVAGEKKKKSGLIGKLKKLTRKSNPTEEKEFGSGSDISSVSVASSAVSAFQRVQQKRAASQDRSKGSAAAAAPAPEPEKRKPATAANDPFEKYFAKSEAASSSVPTPFGRSAQSRCQYYNIFSSSSDAAVKKQEFFIHANIALR